MNDFLFVELVCSDVWFLRLPLKSLAVVEDFNTDWTAAKKWTGKYTSQKPHTYHDRRNVLRDWL